MRRYRFRSEDFAVRRDEENGSSLATFLSAKLSIRFAFERTRRVHARFAAYESAPHEHSNKAVDEVAHEPA
jgi:hypothetical protein